MKSGKSLFFFQAEDGIRDYKVTGVQTCALPICEAQLARESEKLHKTLFDSVSHELKTPLAAISAALEQPRADQAELQQAVRRLTRRSEERRGGEEGRSRWAPDH